MIRSVLIGLLCLSHSMVIHAMQPVSVEGTSVSSAYFNSNIDVISETVNIDISEHFRAAHFTVQYEVYIRQLTTQVPLMFALYDNKLATDTSNNNVAMSITVDGNPVAVQTITSSENEIKFDDFFESYNIKPTGFEIQRVEDNTNIFPDHVSFIKSDFSVGYHTIIATYDARPSYRDNNELTYEYSYDYSFKPIKLKQNLASTTVNLNFQGAIENVSMQVFANGFQDLTGVSNGTVTFRETLPDTIYLSYQRQFSDLVETLIVWPIFGVFILLYIIFSRWHIKSIKDASHSKPLSILWYVLMGSVLVPLASITFIVLNESLIYKAIGAQKIEDMRHFFGFFSYIILFLILAPFYSIFIYIRYYRSSIRRTS